jgi:hypothetical protein
MSGVKKYSTGSKTKRQTRKLLHDFLENNLNSVRNRKSFMKKVTAWSLTNPTIEECNRASFMEAEPQSYAFTKQTAKTYIEHGKNLTIPYDDFLPQPGCNQVVIGLLKDLAEYYDHNDKNKEGIYGNFILLSVESWTEKKNVDYISCAMRNMLQQLECELLPIRILIPKEENALIRKDNDGEDIPRITAKEFDVVYKALLELDYDISKQNKYINTGDEFTYNILLCFPGSSGGKKRRTLKRRTLKRRILKRKTLKRKTLKRRHYK